MRVAIDRVSRLRAAISNTVKEIKAENGSPLYVTTTPFWRRAIGPCPSFMIFWDGFNSPQPERSSGSDLVSTTHRFQLELYSLVGSNEEDSQARFDDLVARTVEALQENHRFGGLCLRSRVTAGDANMFQGQGANAAVYQMLIITLEADCPRW